MDELMDLLVTDGSSSQISDHIKDVLFAKSAENIETIRPNVAASIFDGDINLDPEEDREEEFVSDIEIGSESETEE
jgi:hypothetical protein